MEGRDAELEGRDLSAVYCLPSIVYCLPSALPSIIYCPTNPLYSRRAIALPPHDSAAGCRAAAVDAGGRAGESRPGLGVHRADARPVPLAQARRDRARRRTVVRTRLWKREWHAAQRRASHRAVAPAHGDRITLGDSEVVFHEDGSAPAASQLVAIDSESLATGLSIRFDDEEEARGSELTSRVFSALALAFLEDRPMSDLFDFILDQVVGLLHPSSAAIALFGPDRMTFANQHLRRAKAGDTTDLLISRTLLKEVVEGRKIVSFVDTSQDDRIALAESIIARQIRSAVCAPLIVGDAVLGVLYVDFAGIFGAVGERRRPPARPHRPSGRGQARDDAPPRGSAGQGQDRRRAPQPPTISRAGCCRPSSRRSTATPSPALTTPVRP